MLHNEPNIEMSWQTMLKTFMAHCLLWGSGFLEIQRDGSNRAVALWPRNPGKTRPRRIVTKVTLDAVPWRPFPLVMEPGTYCFETTDSIGEPDQSEIGAKGGQSPTRIVANEDMIHVPGLSLDGRIGQQPVWLARETIGMALMLVKFGAKYFANFSKPGGLLILPGIKKEDRDQARQSWLEAQGGENAHRVAAMPVGTDFKPISNNPQESQSVETRQHIRTEIAALFHVPTRMVGDTQRQSKASTEQENQELLDYTLQPWLSAIKQEVKRKLFPHPGIGSRPRSPFYLDFETWELIRGDSASREKFYASGRQWAYLNTNDIRAFEKLNPINEPWAEQYWIPVNMTLVTTPINPNNQDGAGNGGGGGDDETKARFTQFIRFALTAEGGNPDAKLEELFAAFTAREQKLLPPPVPISGGE